MEERRNKGGRPRGSGKDDSRDLNRVADLMARDSGLKKTPAISRVVEDKYPPHHWQKMVRRLLRKWETTGDARLIEARQRLEEKRRMERAEREEVSRRRIGSTMRDHAVGSLTASQAAKIAEMQVGSVMREYEMGSLTSSMAQLGLGTAVSEMERQINAAMAPLHKLDATSSISAALASLEEPSIQSLMDQIEGPAMRAVREFEEHQNRIRGITDPLWRLR